MKQVVVMILLMSTFIFGASEDYCIDQYNRTLESMQKVIANNKADREFYAKVEANVFQDRVIDLRLKCSKTKNKTINRFLKDSIEAEKAMVTLELLKHTSY